MQRFDAGIDEIPALRDGDALRHRGAGPAGSSLRLSRKFTSGAKSAPRAPQAEANFFACAEVDFVGRMSTARSAR